jgi:hypothetical protein
MSTVIIYCQQKPAFFSHKAEVGSEEQRFRGSVVMTRCRIPETNYEKSSPDFPFNVSDLVTQSNHICQQTNGIDPLNLLETCNGGMRPFLVSEKHVDRQNFVKDQGT